MYKYQHVADTYLVAFPSPVHLVVEYVRVQGFVFRGFGFRLLGVRFRGERHEGVAECDPFSLPVSGRSSV